MTKLVVIEGPDGAGKTTLAKAIVSTYGFEYRHEGPPPVTGSTPDYYTSRMIEAVLRSSETRGVVLDRFALGERVYGPILRGEDRLGQASCSAIVNALRGVGAVQVVCLPPFDACRSSWRARNAERGELIRDEDVFRRTYEAWAALADARPQVPYDWTEPLAWPRLQSTMQEAGR